MQAGKTINQLAQEVERQRKSKRDFLVVTNELSVFTPDRGEYGIGDTEMDLRGQGDFPINAFAHGQLAGHLGIPKPYYDRLRGTIPTLFDTNVNTLLKVQPPDKKGPEKRFLRTLDGRMRALLSDTYRPIDTASMVGPLFNELADWPSLQVDSSDITETRFYLKVSTPRMMADVKVGDPVQMGVLIQNSEVGRGRWRTLPFLKRLVCVNGMIMEDYGTSRNHVGKRLGYGELEPEDIFAYMTDEALAADNHAFFLKVRDSIRAVMSDRVLEILLERMTAATTVGIRNPEAAVVEVSRWADLTEPEENDVMRHLIEGGDLSLWGLANAITAAADDTKDYDRNTEMQVLGGRIITLDPKEYRVITEAEAAVSKRRRNVKALENVALSAY